MQSWTLSSGKSRESLKTPRMILKLGSKSGESFPCSRKTTCWGNRWRRISENLVGRNMRKWKLVDLSCGANLPIIFYALFIFSLFIVFFTLYRCRYITNTTSLQRFRKSFCNFWHLEIIERVEEQTSFHKRMFASSNFKHF